MNFSPEKRLKREDELSKEYGFTRNFMKEKKNFFLFFGENLKENYEDKLVNLLVFLNENEENYLMYKRLFEEGVTYTRNRNDCIRFKDEKLGFPLFDSLKNYQTSIRLIKTYTERLINLTQEIEYLLGWKFEGMEKFEGMKKWNEEEN